MVRPAKRRAAFGGAHLSVDEILARVARQGGGGLGGPPAPQSDGFSPLDLLGPPPGIEEDVGEYRWRVMKQPPGKQAPPAELRWATSDWGFDLHTIPTTLDFHCGALDAQASFALVLADRNPDARFHYFSLWPTSPIRTPTRRRMMGRIAGYFDQGSQASGTPRRRRALAVARIAAGLSWRPEIREAPPPARWCSAAKSR